MINIQTAEITKTKEIILSAVFTALAVGAPVVAHYFGGVDAGRKFLPMPFFVLLAGLALGWRAGLVTGLFAPVISFLISGMPILSMLPFVTLQLAAYGLIAGIVQEKFSAVVSVAIAIVAGWLVIGTALFLFSEMNAIAYIVQGMKIGYLGIALQLIMIPLIAKAIQHYDISQ